jgi:hypothetical protein
MLKTLFLSGLMVIAANLNAALKVQTQKDTIILENSFIQAEIVAQGGKLAKLYDKQTKREYAITASGKSGAGMAKTRIWEKPGWVEHYKAKYKLEVIRNTPNEIAVRASARAFSGPGKGMDFTRTYILRKGECRLKVDFRINSNEHWATFSPWLHNMVTLPSELQDKRNTVIYCQTEQGLYADTPTKPKFGQAVIGNHSSPWVAVVSEKSKTGLAIVSSSRQLSHFYCWYGSEYFFTMETVFDKNKFAPGGSWSAVTWYIPFKGLQNCVAATPRYVAGIAAQGITFFEAAPIDKANIAIKIGKQQIQKYQLAKLVAGKNFTLPVKTGKTMQEVTIKINGDGTETENTGRGKIGRGVCEAKPQTKLEDAGKGARNTAFASYSKDTLFISKDMAVTAHFALTDKFDKKSSKVKVILELPEGIRVSGHAKHTPMSKKAIVIDGAKYTQYTFAGRSRSYYAWTFMFVETDWPADKTGTAYLYATWIGGRQKTEKIKIKTVEVKACKRIPKRLLTGLGFYGIPTIKIWPNIYKNLKRVGLNCISLNYTDTRDIPLMNKYVMKARSEGMNVKGNYSPFCRVELLATDKNAWVQAIDGEKRKFLCPSYRGKILDREMSSATAFAAAGVGIVYWDAEAWRGREFCFCERCMKNFSTYFKQKHGKMKFISPKEFEKDFQKYPAYHDIWIKFRVSLGTELFVMMKDLYFKRFKASGVKWPKPQPIIGSYDVTPGKLYHQFIRFDEQYKAGAINICMPSLYVSGDAAKVGRVVRETRAAIGSNRLIPWFTGGWNSSGECDGIDQKYILLENFLNGSMGFTTWPWMAWDADDLRYMSQVMNMVIPLEDIIVDGKVMQGLKTSNKHVKFVGMQLGNKAAMLVSDYYHDSLPEVTLSLKVPAACNLYDVATSTKLASLKAGVNAVKIPAYPEKARLLSFGKKAPVISYKCPPVKAVKKTVSKLVDPTIPGDTLKLKKVGSRIWVENRFYKLGFVTGNGTLCNALWKNGKKQIKTGWLGGESIHDTRAGGFRMSGRGVTADVKTRDLANGAKQLIAITDYGTTGNKMVKPVKTKFTYTFYPGKPVFKLEISARQPKGQTWSQCRFNQYNFKDNKWKNVTMGEKMITKPLSLAKGDNKTSSRREGYNWWGVSDAKDALAIISVGSQPRGFVYVYDPTRMYVVGRYGPWKTPKMDMEQFVYFGPADPHNIRKWAKYLRQADL